LWRELELNATYVEVWKAYKNCLKKCSIKLNDEEYVEIINTTERGG